MDKEYFETFETCETSMKHISVKVQFFQVPP